MINYQVMKNSHVDNSWLKINHLLYMALISVQVAGTTLGLLTLPVVTPDYSANSSPSAPLKVAPKPLKRI